LPDDGRIRFHTNNAGSGGGGILEVQIHTDPDSHLLLPQVTSRVVKISELQEIFSEKVLQQSTGE
jgi:predicted outer membrane repeat protein